MRCEALLELGGDEQRGDAEQLQLVERHRLHLEEVVDERHRHVQRVLLQTQVVLHETSRRQSVRE